MSYETADPNTLSFIISYSIFVVFCIIMTSLIFFRYKERKKKSSYFLFLTFLVFTIVMSTLLVGLVEMQLDGIKGDVYRITLAIGNAGFMISNIFILLFSLEVFNFKLKHTKGLIYLFIFFAILIALPQNYYGIPDAEEGPDNIRIYTSMLLFIVPLILCLKITGQSFRTSRLIDEKWAKVPFKWIAFGQISMILFYVFVMLNTVGLKLLNMTGFTPFMYLAELFAGLYFIFNYLALILPIWVRKWIGAPIEVK